MDGLTNKKRAGKQGIFRYVHKDLNQNVESSRHLFIQLD